MGKGCHFSRYESISGHYRFTIIDTCIYKFLPSTSRSNAFKLELYKNHLYSGSTFFLYFDVSYSLYPEKKNICRMKKKCQRFMKIAGAQIQA